MSVIGSIVKSTEILAISKKTVLLAQPQGHKLQCHRIECPFSDHFAYVHASERVSFRSHKRGQAIALSVCWTTETAPRSQ